MLILENGELAERIKNDPRWSESQREAAAKAAAADPNARVVGLDERMRPVLTCKLDPRSAPSEYAVLRNGAPAKPQRPLAETWRARRSPTRSRSTR